MYDDAAFTSTAVVLSAISPAHAGAPSQHSEQLQHRNGMMQKTTRDPVAASTRWVDVPRLTASAPTDLALQ